MREIIGFIPGPLEAIFGETYTIREKDGGIVCMMSWLKGKFGCKGRRNEKSVRATAELLAAAPGLYAECQTLRSQRDALREALEKIANRLDYNSSHEDGVADEMQSVAQSVLDATKEPV